MLKPYDKVIERIRGAPYLIHHNDETPYAYLGDGEISIEVLNDDRENNMSIDTDGVEYTLFFGYNHVHFYVDEADELDCLLRCVEEILCNQRCCASLFCYGDNGRLRWLESRFLTEDSEMNDSMENIFYAYREKEFRDCIRKNGGEARFCFWTASLNKAVLIPKEGD